MRNKKSLHPVIIFFQPLWIACFFLALSAAHSNANDHDPLSMNGVAAHWTLGREYYIGALYLPQTTNDADSIFSMTGPKRMELKVTSDSWSPRRFTQMWNQSILINNSQDDLNKMSKAIIAFTSLAKDNLVYGDQIVIDYTPGKGTSVAINNTELMTTSHEGFFNVLLSIWIGRRPPSSEFKNDMLNLSQTEEGQDLIGRYEVVLPEAGRAKITAEWAPQKDQPKTAAVATPKVAPKAAEKKPTPPKAAEPKIAIAARPSPKETKETPPSKPAEPIKPVSQVVSAPLVPETKPAEKPADIKPLTDKVDNIIETAKTEPAVAVVPPAVAALIDTPEVPKIGLSSENKKAATSVEKTKKVESQPVKPATSAASDAANTQKTVDKTDTQKPPALTKAAPVKKAKPAVDPEKARITGLQNIYRANMLRYTYRHVVYPSRALSLNQEGTVVLKVTVNRKGKVLDIEHDQRSEYVALNKAAEKAVKKANPYPEIPDELLGDKFEFKIPIKFRIPR